MARSARDLRDIINVSRLSIRGTSSDEFSSGNELNVETKTEIDELSNYLSSRPSSVMEESSFETISEFTRPGSSRGRPQTSASYRNHGKINGRPSTAPPVRNNNEAQRMSDATVSGRNTVPFIRLSFPNKYTPVPPISKTNSGNSITEHKVKCDNGTLMRKNSSDTQNSYTKSNIKITQSSSGLKQKSFDHIFQYLDGTIVSGWLEVCNNILDHITEFVKTGDNFVEFAHFFLAILTSERYCELLDLEFSIIIDQLRYAFRAGCNDGHVKMNDLYLLASSVIKEYPKKIKNSKKGTKLLLDIIIVFCSDKNETYRKLLKNVNCTTDNKQYAQWLLAIRAFGLISFVSGVLKFYENVLALQEILTNKDEIANQEVLLDLNKLIIQAVQQDYLEVLDYLYNHKSVKFRDVVDKKQRNLIFIAATEGNVDILNYLSELPIEININVPSENGNTALQLAVSKGDIETAVTLLQIGADPNQWNEQSEGATALHTAVMLGDVEMVKLLVKHGADKTSRMGVLATTTPLSLAQELEHGEIVELLK